MAEQNSNEHEEYLEQNRRIWDEEAANFDKEADHGLSDARVRSAWKALLEKALPEKELSILDIGCGTGSLSLLLAELGHRVKGIDLSPAMIAQAKAKASAANQAIEFQVMDAAYPEFSEKFDAILCRHLLWTLPEPTAIIQRWMKLLKPQGRLVLIEGYWHTGAGIQAKEALALLPSSMTEPVLQNLSAEADLWGTAVNDERYLIRAQLAP